MKSNRTHRGRVVGVMLFVVLAVVGVGYATASVSAEGVTHAVVAGGADRAAGPAAATAEGGRPVSAVTVGDVLARLAIDLAAIAVLAYAIYYRRHGRQDLFVVYVLFNIGLFLALTVITSGDVGLGVGFGLFAVLSIIRLRSEPYSNTELAYFFVALVLALVTGIDVGSPLISLALASVALAAATVVGHPRLLRPTRALEVTLETIPAGDDALRFELETRLGAEVVEAQVLEIDYVRETTRVAVRCAAAPAPTGTPDAAVSAGR